MGVGLCRGLNKWGKGLRWCAGIHLDEEKFDDLFLLFPS